MKETLSAGGSARLCDDSAAIALFSREVCVSFDRLGRCVALSRNWPQVTGHGVEDSAGAAFWELLRKIDADKLKPHVKRGSLVRRLRLRMRHPLGNWEWFEVTDLRRAGTDRVEMVLLKITGEVEKENALQKASIEAELAMRGQSEFFAHISHELRTPLNAILGFAQMMRQGMFGEIANPRYRDYLQFLEQSGQDLLGKIDDLLEISSLSAGIGCVAEQQVDLGAIVGSAVDVHARELFRRHIRAEIRLPTLALIGDRIKLQQAVTHLLKNAIKFSPDHGRVFLEAKVTEEGALELMLRDQGPGFSAEQLHYFREQSRSFTFLERNRRLMGFGLPLADELIRLHGGRIRCENQEGGGARVTVTLPAKRVVRPLEQRRRAASVGAGTAFSSAASREEMSPAL